eukprot:112305-Prymnesium_polylepis.1
MPPEVEEWARGRHPSLLENRLRKAYPHVHLPTLAGGGEEPLRPPPRRRTPRARTAAPKRLCQRLPRPQGPSRI